MSLDPSLKSSGGLVKHRNVLTRAQRIERLAERGKFDLARDNPLGLPKVANRKVVVASKSAKKKEEPTAEAPETTEASAPSSD